MSFLRYQHCIFRLIGYNLHGPESSLRRLFNLLNLILLYAIIWPESAYVWHNLGDIRRATRGLCPLLCGISSAARLLTLSCRRKRFVQLTVDLKSLWRPDEKNGEGQVLLNGLNRETCLSLPYILSTSAVVILYLASPLVQATYQSWLTNSSNVTWEMPMRSIFPYDIRQSPQFELTYIWFAQATLLAGLAATGVDTLFYASAFSLSSHLQIIQQRARRIRYDVWPMAEIRDVVEYHNRIAELIEFVAETYQPVLLTHFAISSVQICVIAYQLTLPDTDAMVYTAFLLAIGLQCFVYCHGGTRLETESVAVADAWYSGQWYLAAGRIQLLVKLCVLRAQRPVQVRSVFFAANFGTLTWIFKTAGSYVALLQSISS